MIVVNSRRYFLDSLLDLVGIKSGLVVTADDLDRLALGDDVDRWWQGDLSEGLRIRAEDFQTTFIHVLHSIGALPNPKPIERLVSEFCAGREIALPDSDPFAGLPQSYRVVSFVYQAVLERALRAEPL